MVRGQRLGARRLVIEGVAVAALYVASGHVGLMLAQVGTNITLVWPPTGISVAALVLRDRRLWPAVTIAAFLVNLLAGSSAEVCAAIAVGNTLGPIVAATILERRGFDGRFDRRSRVADLALATAIGMIVPALFGVSALVAAGVVEVTPSPEAAALWWLGDCLGVICFLPLAAELRAIASLAPPRRLELAGAIALAAALGALVFFVPGAARLAFLLWVPIVWGALRFPGKGAALLVAVAVVFAVLGTASGHGSFATAEPLPGLLVLAVYLASTALVTLFVGALLAERDEAARQAREGEERLAAILETAHDAFVATDAEGRVVLWNRAAERMFGAPAAEVTGRSIERFVPAGIVARGGGERVLGTLRREDGAELPAEITISRARAGETELVTLAIRDRSAEQRAEERERELEAQLRHADKLRALGTLASGVAHDFNNVLTGILMGLELLRRKVGESGPLGATIDDMRAAGQRAADVVRDLLAFARPRPVERRVVRVADVAGEVRSLLRASFPATVALELAIDDASVCASADPTQLHQVLVNLATNARQALAEGRGRIEIRVRRVELEPAGAAARGALAGRYACIEVRDDGAGMDAETMARIFEPFFTRRSGEPGSGLGLAMVHGIVSAHGGFVTVESAPGAGSVFRVHLPAVDAARPEVVPGAAAIEGSLAGLAVLVVDDDAAVLEVMSRTIEHAGASVTRAPGADEALAALAHDRFDLVLTDHAMPGRTGVELARAVRASHAGARVVLMSGQAALLDEGEIRGAGVVATIAKPCSGAELVARLAAARS